MKRREAKNKGEKERYKHLNAEFQRIARKDKKAFFQDQCKKYSLRRINGYEKEKSKKQRKKGKIYTFECRVPKNSKERYENLPK